MAKQTKKQAVEERTQQRLAARKEAAQRGAETRRAKFEQQHPEVAAKLARRGGKAALKKHEAKLVAETRKMLDAEAAAEPQTEQPKPAPTAPQAPKAEKPQPQGVERQTKRPERNVAQTGRAAGPIHGEQSRTMATVALRGEQAERLRALAAKHELTLAKLLVRMMEVFEAAAK
jgi:hypothetical protein